MDEQRPDEYLKLIEALLTCENDEQAALLLQQHPDLVNDNLVEIMEDYALKLSNKGPDNTAIWLQNLTDITIAINTLSAINTQSGKQPTWKQLNRTIVVLQYRGQYSRATPLAEYALSVALERWEEEHENVATSLNNLAHLYSFQGRYSEAEPLYKKALAITRKLFSEEHPYVATTLNNLAFLCYSQARYAEAESFYKDSLEITRKFFPDNRADIATTLNNLGLLCHSQARYAEAESFYKDSLEIRRRLFVNDHHYIASNLNNLACLYYSQGRYAQAEPFYKEALEITRRLFPNDHPYVASSLNNLAYLYYSQGRYAQAEPFYKEALEIWRRFLPDDQADIASSLDNLALLYHAQGRYSEAEPLYVEALEIWRRLFPNDHPDLASSFNNLALFYLSQERYAEAEPFYRESLAITRRLFPNNHPDVASSLNSLAYLYYCQGRYAEAELLYGQALAMQRQLFPNNHSDIAITLNNFGELYRSQERYAQAKPLYVEALEILHGLFPNDHPYLASSLNNLALLYSFQKCYEEAETLYRESLAMRRRLLTDTHPDIINSLRNLALLYSSQKRYGETLTHFQEILAVEKRLLNRLLITSSEGQLWHSIQRQQSTFRALLSLVITHFQDSQDILGTTLDIVLQRKAIGTAAQTAFFNALNSDRYTDLQPQLLQYRDLCEQITYLQYFPPDTDPQKQRAIVQQLRETSAAAEDLYRQLVGQIPEIQETLETTIDRHAIASKLPPNSILVEFAYFNFYDFNNEQWQPPRYLAFILSQQSDRITMIDLPEGELINHLIQEVRNNLIDLFGISLAVPKEPDDPLPEQALRQRVFDPIAPYLQPGQIVFLATDGALNSFPLGILPSASGRYLMEEYDFRYLVAGRDILRRVPEQSSNLTTALIIANPDYNLKLSSESNLPSPTTQTHNPIPTYQDLADLRASKSFKPLPGSQIEGERIAHLFETQAYIQQHALKSVLTQIQTSPTIVHLTTHGFFLRNLPYQPQDFFNPLKDKPAPLQNPLLRSGLAFAGANTFLKREPLPDNAEGGLLTALESAALNLADTEIFIASACETALGDIQVGEGVAGFRRALLVAGAKTLVVSLWKVDDIATSILMERFYRNLLEGERNRTRALENAQYYVRDLTIGEMRQEWLNPETIKQVNRYSSKTASSLKELEKMPNDCCPYQDPFYWGAFICIGSGEGRSLAGPRSCSCQSC